MDEWFQELEREAERGSEVEATSEGSDRGASSSWGTGASASGSAGGLRRELPPHRRARSAKVVGSGPGGPWSSRLVRVIYEDRARAHVRCGCSRTWGLARRARPARATNTSALAIRTDGAQHAMQHACLLDYLCAQLKLSCFLAAVTIIWWKCSYSRTLFIQFTKPA